VLAYGSGQASSGLLARIDEHLDQCLGCRELVETVVAEEQGCASYSSQLTTFHAGSLLEGRYRVLRFLGKGGMGEVYEARDELTQKRVALKTVLCTAADDPRAIRKLFGEVVHAQRVAHPHVFKIYDLHEHVEPRHGRMPFFTMEFVEGEPLGKRLRRSGALPVPQARDIAQQLLSGLSAAHDKGVLHLDFKSDNVMLRGSEAQPDAVIMDFGLSKVSDVSAEQPTTERSQGVGTLAYMAIEQLECRKEVGAPADVYAFGVVLYEMLTGSLPFRGNSMSAILLKQLTQRPAPASGQARGLSPEVDAFVQKCLQREPSLRFANAGEALAALEALGPWLLPPRRRSSPGIWPLAALALIIGCALTIRLMGNERHPPLRAAVSKLVPAAAAAATAHSPEPEPQIVAQRHEGPAASAPPAPLPATPAKHRRAPSSHPPPASSTRARAAEGAAEPQHPASAASPAAATEAPLPPADWRGPPPKAVPRPAPL
jgi:serine/threonine protein kinase